MNLSRARGGRIRESSAKPPTPRRSPVPGRSARAALERHPPLGAVEYVTFPTMP